MGYQVFMVPESERVSIVLAEPLGCLCCPTIIPAGDTITIYGHHRAQTGLKKRRTAFIWHHLPDNKSGHNVRLSKIRVAE